MHTSNVRFGLRRLQVSGCSLSINIPRVAVDTIGLEAGETMSVTMLPDCSLVLVKE
jgi:hypothetical protein